MFLGELIYQCLAHSERNFASALQSELFVYPVCYELDCVPQSSYLEALTLDGTVFWR